ncbi:HTH-type transcriptional regulator YesS [Clostridiales bacterium]|nr:HTH-type transcriptional regulator YesS [Clostridiales bacterium]
MKEYGLTLMKGRYWTAMKINFGGESSFYSMTKEENMTTVSVRRLLENRLKEWGEFASFHRPSGLSVIVALDNEDLLTGLMTLLDDVCRESRKIFRQPLTIGIGRIVNRIEEIEKSYSSAREAVSYGRIAGDVIYINDVEPQQKLMICLSDKTGAELNHAICFGAEESIISCVESVVCPMKDNGSSGTQAYLIGILNVILRVVQKYGLDEQLIFGEYGDYNGVLSGIKTADDTARWLLGVCFCVSGCVSNARQGTTRTIIQEAKRYIEENYQNSMLSLEMLCAHLHMSTAYFSTMFKREVGESYTSYLTGIRMEKAAELLRSTDDKTYAIAARVGYDEPNYFSYVFKKRYGVSPNKFRGK